MKIIIIVVTISILLTIECYGQNTIPDFPAISIQIGLQGCLNSDGKMSQDRYSIMPINSDSAFLRVLNQKYRYSGQNIQITRESIIENNLVDWVYIELRNAENTNEYISKIFVVNIEGQILETDNFTEQLRFPVQNGDYWLIICHNSHIKVMSSRPLTLEAHQIVNWNFRESRENYYKGDAAYVYGVYCLYSGEFAGNLPCPSSETGNNIIDLDEWCEYTNYLNVTKKYLLCDANMSGRVTSEDWNYFIYPNIKKYSKVPYGY